jgi:hypothetical protein
LKRIGAGLVFLAASALAVRAQAPVPAARLTLLPPSDSDIAARSAELSLLPPHSSNVQLERKQIAHLVAPGQRELWLVPVRFWHGEPSDLDADRTLVSRDRCGLLVMTPGGGDQYFLFTIRMDQDLAVDQCGGLKVIARAGAGAHPELKLTYRTFSPPRQEDTVYVQLLWDGKAGRYTVGKAGD